MTEKENSEFVVLFYERIIEYARCLCTNAKQLFHYTYI